MIDTVILKIPRHLIQMPNSPEWQSFLQNAHSQKWIRNMTVQEKRSQIYRPRITGQKRTGSIDFIKLEFSCPKIVFGNNVDELTEKDFDLLLGCLQRNLKEINITVTLDILRNAGVTGFHPSKNIDLTRGYTSRFVIKELNKINIKKTFDLNKTDFRNDGQSLQVYSNSHSLVFYDKIADLARPPKRAIDRDHGQQLQLFKKLRDTQKFREILRIEVRLCNKVKINSILKRLHLPINPTFKDLFQMNLCKKTLLDYWGNIVSQYNGIILNEELPQTRFFSNLIRDSPTINAKEAIYLVGLKTIANQESGISHFRALIEKAYSTRTWYRVAKDIKRLNQVSNLSRQEWVTQIEEQLNSFNALKK